ncbi:hypothetical protein ER308_18025 [Egibacter rhizosphaerae]|uniref:Uncharacterized protein n=1 Tax=Egibacter rhizosphaerae TaxID=1670831 RepID=A0A411YJE8_9ACTN|nr:hypothetical protein [Egibacter rhizosphaerae]QBI21281.1 hypothetical protein ER308_18025 [Egibacter rhizosphaerae]
MALFGALLMVAASCTSDEPEVESAEPPDSEGDADPAPTSAEEDTTDPSPEDPNDSDEEAEDNAADDEADPADDEELTTGEFARPDEFDEDHLVESYQKLEEIDSESLNRVLEDGEWTEENTKYLDWMYTEEEASRRREALLGPVDFAEREERGLSDEPRPADVIGIDRAIEDYWPDCVHVEFIIDESPFFADGYSGVQRPVYTTLVPRDPGRVSSQYNPTPWVQWDATVTVDAEPVEEQDLRAPCEEEVLR